ncbi:MAG: hypothetical protein H6707_18015 [Deltaproteobacteria bacterium]|nr:hypothetical protein [Deltaproteobacteria bacterium]
MGRLTSLGKGSSLRLLGLVVVVALAHGRSLSNGFVGDDLPGIVDHPVVNGSASIRDLLAYNHLGRPIVSSHPVLRPLPTLVFAAIYRAGGGQPWHFHLLSLVLYLLVVVLAYRLFARFFSAGIAWCGAALFAALAIHVDVVAPAFHLSELSALVFVLLMLEAAIARRPVWAMLAYGAALLSKESAILAPLIVAAWGITDRALWRWRSLLPLIAVGLVFIIWRVAVLPFDVNGTTVAADNPLTLADGGTRLWMVFSLLGRYLALTVAPIDLAYDYTYSAIFPQFQLRDLFGWLGLAFSAVLLLSIAWAWRRSLSGRPGVSAVGRSTPAARLFQLASAGVLSFGFSYGLASNALFLITVIFAERLFFAPSLWVIFLGLLLVDATIAYRRALARWWIVLAVGLTLTNIGLASMRTTEWQTPHALFSAQVAAQPDSVKGRLYLARSFSARGKHLEAGWQLGLALVGRRSWPARWKAPRVDALPLAQRLARLPALIAPKDPDQAIRGLVEQARRLLGPSTALALAHYYDARRRARGEPRRPGSP